MTDAPAPTAVSPVADLPFPPETLQAFSQLCVGRWMSLRSTFALDGSEEWHQSERGEVEIRSDDDPTGCAALTVSDGEGKPLSRLVFSADGVVQRAGGAAQANQSGGWQLRKDGCLELRFPADDDAEVLERVWFIKANLRLRTTTLVDRSGTPQQASFCSEIRRVSSPAR